MPAHRVRLDDARELEDFPGFVAQQTGDTAVELRFDRPETPSGTLHPEQCL